MYSTAIFACLFSLAVLLILAPVSKWMERVFGTPANGGSEEEADELLPPPPRVRKSHRE